MEVIKSAKASPYESKFGQIRFGVISGKFIIPVCISISNNNKIHGTICGCISLEELSKKLEYHIKDKNINKIELLNFDSKEDNGNRIHNSFTFSNIIEHAIEDKSLIIYEPLHSYPALLKAELNCYFLSREIIKVILYPSVCFLLILLLIYCLLKVQNHYYSKPLKMVNEKICDHLNILDNSGVEYKSMNYIRPQKLSQALIYIINYCSMLHNSVAQSKLEKPTQELRKKILEFVLDSYNKNLQANKIDSDVLYLSKLDELVNSEKEVINLQKFLKNTFNYCLTYHSELDIRYKTAKNEYEDFSVRPSLLAETIFAILTLITRIEKINTENSIILDISFEDNLLPSFAFEVSTFNFESQEPLDMDLHMYNGLLTIYLLAKENNYFINVIQIDDKLIFKLQPFDSGQIKSITEFFGKIPFASVLSA